MSCTALRESVGGQRPTRGRRRGNHLRAVVGKVIPGRGEDMCWNPPARFSKGSGWGM